jgi:hypothetical protein
VPIGNPNCLAFELPKVEMVPQGTGPAHNTLPWSCQPCELGVGPASPLFVVVLVPMCHATSVCSCAGALLMLTPPAYAMGKVANQGSEYMTSLGHLPKAGMGVSNSAWKWVNKQAAAGAGVVAAFGVAVLMKRPRSGSRQSTPRTTHPAGPPSPA